MTSVTTGSSTGTATLFSPTGPTGYANLSKQNTNLTGFNLTTADLQVLNTVPTDLLGGAQGSNSTLLTSAAAAIYQPLDGFTQASAVQGTGLASVAAGLTAAGYATVADAQAANATVNQIFPAGYLTQKGSVKTFGLNATPTQQDDVVAPSNLDPSTFEQWSTGYQKQYIAFWTSNYATNRSKGLTDFQIGANTGNSIDVVVTPSIAQSGPNKGTALPESQIQVIVVQNLTKTTLAALSADEQTLVAQNQAFPALAATLGMSVNTTVVSSPVSGAPTSQSAANITAAIATLIQEAQGAGVPIDSNGNYNGPSGQQATYNNKQDGRPVNYSDVDVFIQEFQELQKQLATTPIVNDDSVKAKIQAIADRAQTAIDFGSVPNQVSAAAVGPGGPGYHDQNGQIDNFVGMTKNVVSTDVANTTSTTQTVYLHVLEDHDGGDYDGIPADWIASQADLHVDTGNFISQLGYDPRDANGYLYIVEPDNTKLELKPGVTVQVDQFGRLIGKVEDANGNVITSLFSAGDPTAKNSKPMAHLQIIAQGYTGPVMNLAGTQLASTDYHAVIQNASYDNNVLNNILYFQKSANPGKPPTETIQLPVTTPGAASNQTTTTSGYQKMMQAERQTLGLINQMDSVAASDSLGTKTLDVPSLIFFLQLYTNQIDEQQIDASTEVVNQLNDLLNTYSQMQNLVNAVQTKFTAGNQTEERDIFGNVTNNGNLTPFYWNNLTQPGFKTQSGTVVQTAPNGQASLNIVSMFDKLLGSGAQNPIEAKFNITRPLQQMVDLGTNGTSGTGNTVGYTATAWNSFATSLSSTVTQLNQQVQILMNNINSLDKEKDQHYDMANNTASKMSDLLTAITRNLN